MYNYSDGSQCKHIWAHKVFDCHTQMKFNLQTLTKVRTTKTKEKKKDTHRDFSETVFEPSVFAVSQFTLS